MNHNNTPKSAQIQFVYDNFEMVFELFNAYPVVVKCKPSVRTILRWQALDQSKAALTPPSLAAQESSQDSTSLPGSIVKVNQSN